MAEKRTLPRMTDSRLKKVPNSDVWIDPFSVVAVARMKDSTIKGDNDSILTCVNFSIRMLDGKAINLQSPNRMELKEFLDIIGVRWTDG